MACSFTKPLSQKSTKNDLLNKKDFLDEKEVPRKMVNIIIDSLQTYVIEYLQSHSTHNLLNNSRSFERILSEILLRKFLFGVNHSHFLAGDQEQNYFPWEGIFDIKGKTKMLLGPTQKY